MITNEEDPSSTCIQTWVYDVFLSFRGEETREGFTGNLYNTLHQRGVRTFIDDEKLKRGEDISPTLLKAIEESRVSIVVFSDNYANSSWCLDELVTIMESLTELEKKFHINKERTLAEHEKESDIDMERAILSEHEEKSDIEETERALTEHENKSNIDIERMNKWRSAMHELSNLSGTHVKYGYEYQFNEKIIRDISSRLGVHGLGGIGKTTLARAVYNDIANKFDCKSFLSNVRETSTKEGLLQLQKTLLGDTLGDKDFSLTDVKEGMERIQHGLLQKKVLIVLDDVDQLEQLQMLVEKDWFGTGSTIIVTTRDKHLLTAHDIDIKYEMKQPAILALKIIGSDLIGKGMDEWKSTLEKYERVPNKDIQSILRISYDNLDENEKQIFLDKGMSVETCKKVLKGFGFHPDSAITPLLDKSILLLKENTLWMHDLIEEMGREIVRQESPTDPGNRTRLWFHEDALQVLKENSGSEKIEGIMLSLPYEETVEWSGEVFEKMKNLRLLVIENANFSKGPKHLPSSLRVLDWKNYPSQSLPTDFDPTKLVILNLPHSSDFTLNVAVIKTLESLRLALLYPEGYSRGVST
ncbi:Resistance protein [Quillaja saponaria]|uniref:Resistance protein n=1 Tax=Quillaja saponaria TaxID=32244 RepID=A0AAD7Q5X5_QUISA|nr:Resistance protein [Quillaja saponaria]